MKLKLGEADMSSPVKPQKRIYEKGRPTTGWKRSKRLNDFSSLKVGDRCILVSDQFKAENLIMVSRTKIPPHTAGEIIYWQYVKPESTRKTEDRSKVAEGGPHALWKFDIGRKGPVRLFKATRGS